jgi:hypothetical protein
MKRLLTSTIVICAIASSQAHAQWMQTNEPYGGTVLCFAVSDTNLFAGTDDSGVFRSTNNGASWAAVNAALTDTSAHALAVGGTNLFARTDLFGKRGRAWLESVPISETDREPLTQTLKLLDEVTEGIRATEATVRELARSNPSVVYLKTVPGLGEFFATLIAYEIDEVHRFRNAAKLHAYVGVIPSTYSSGGKTFHGRMTKRGNKYVRWAVIEAVAPAIKKDSSLRRYYEQLKARKGPNKARIATARRLLTIIYNVVMEQRPYEVR